MLLWTALAWASDCPYRTTTDTLQSQLDGANAAFANLDVDGFVSSLQDVALTLPCLNDPVTVELAAHYHRTEALRLYVEGKDAEALPPLEAAHALKPDFTYPEGQFPKGYPLLQQWQSLSATPAQTLGIRRPPSGRALFDGVEGRKRPTDRPTLIQVVDNDGAIEQTWYLRPADPWPYGEVPRLRNGLLIASGASVLLAAGLYGAGWASRTRYFADDPTYDGDKLDSIASRTNLLFGSAIGFAIAGGAAGTTGLLVGRR